MPSWFSLRKAPPSDCVGLSLYAGGFACCVVDRAANKLVSANVQALTSDAGLADALLHWVREHDLKGRTCYLSLGPDDYKLLPAEAPAVPEAEINQALLWGLRDVIDGKPEDIVLDSFASASGIQRPDKPIRQVVTARKARIQAIVDAVLGAGLELAAIEVPELSQRNVIAQLQEDAIGVGLVSQSARGVSLAIYRGGELYVARQLAGIANLGDAGHPLTAPRLAEQLGLELLRTLDYYDSQLHQRPPAAIMLQPLQTETRPLLDGLSTTINLPVKQLRFADAITGGDAVSDEIQERCFNALGAALRSATSATQQINLYTTEFRPQHRWLTPQHCVQSWGATFAIGLVVAIALGWHNHSLRNRSAVLQAQVQTAQNALAADQTRLASRITSPQLVAELKRRSLETAAKKELLEALESGVIVGRQGYTPILTSLARTTLDDLWLNTIEIARGDVNLTGATHKAELIPAYIDKIVGDADFGPRGYESLKVKTDEHGLLTFELRGHRNDTNATAVR